MKKKRKTRKLTKTIVMIIIAFSILLIILLIIQSHILDLFTDLFKEPELFIIRDECSLIVGQIIHEMKNEGDCKIMCTNNCILRDMKYYNSSFIQKINSCHTCNCYCK